MASTSLLLCALALLPSCWTALATRASAEGGAGGGGGLNQLLGRGGAGETPPRGDLHTRVSRMEKMTPSELERELRTKEIMAAISGTPPDHLRYALRCALRYAPQTISGTPSGTPLDHLRYALRCALRYVPQTISGTPSEMVNSECPSSRDYQGWVDFGRRSAERTE
ncbi:unnamed protein product [Boreogadus saida]